MQWICGLVLVQAIAVGGCSGGVSGGVMNGIMSSWQGTHIDQVVARWGYPTSERNFRGKKLYVWDYRKSATLPAQSTTTGTIVGNQLYAKTTTNSGGTLHGLCRRILEVDGKGIVVKWQWEGNNCPFAEAFEYSSWRK